MKNLKVNNIEIKITKKEIAAAIKSELRFDFGRVANDVFSILVMASRAVDFDEVGCSTLKEKTAYFYVNAKTKIEDAAFNFTPVAHYFGLPTVN